MATIKAIRDSRATLITTKGQLKAMAAEIEILEMAILFTAQRTLLRRDDVYHSDSFENFFANENYAI